jgi:hypothetical protein
VGTSATPTVWWTDQKPINGQPMSLPATEIGDNYPFLEGFSTSFATGGSPVQTVNVSVTRQSYDPSGHTIALAGTAEMTGNNNSTGSVDAGLLSLQASQPGFEVKSISVSMQPRGTEVLDNQKVVFDQPRSLVGALVTGFSLSLQAMERVQWIQVGTDALSPAALDPQTGQTVTFPVYGRIHRLGGDHTVSGSVDLLLIGARSPMRPPMAAPTATPSNEDPASFNNVIPQGPKWVPGYQVRYAVSFFNAENQQETLTGPWSDWISSLKLCWPRLWAIPTDPSRQASGRKIYRQFNGYAVELVGTINDNTTTFFDDRTD